MAGDLSDKSYNDNPALQSLFAIASLSIFLELIASPVVQPEMITVNANNVKREIKNSFFQAIRLTDLIIIKS